MSRTSLHGAAASSALSSPQLPQGPRLSSAQHVRLHEGGSASGLHASRSHSRSGPAPHAASLAADAGASSAATAAERPVSASGRPTRGLAAYRVRKQIGRGKFGVCQLVECIDSGLPFVLKVIPLGSLSASERVSALGEVEALKRLARPRSHPFIVRYRESFLQQDALHIVMQHCAGGDLHAHLRARKAVGAYLPEEQIIDWLTQLLLALRRCHDNRIIHRDLKTQVTRTNIFLVPSKTGAPVAGASEGVVPVSAPVGAYQIKLGDYGISKILNSTSDLAMSVVGTPYSMSPEVCENRPYSYQSDVWSCGCLHPDTELWLHDGTTIRARQLLPHHKLLDEHGNAVSIVPNSLIGTDVFPMPAVPGFYPTAGGAPGALTPSVGWQTLRIIHARDSAFDDFIVSSNHTLTVGHTQAAGGVGDDSAAIQRVAAFHLPEHAATADILVKNAPAVHLVDIRVDEFERLPPHDKSQLLAVKVSEAIRFTGGGNNYFRDALAQAMVDAGLPSGGDVDGVAYESALSFRVAQLELAMRMPLAMDAASVTMRAPLVEAGHRGPADKHEAVSFPTPEQLAAAPDAIDMIQRYILKVSSWVVGLWQADGDSDGLRIFDAPHTQTQQGTNQMPTAFDGDSGVFQRYRHWVDLLGLPPAELPLSPAPSQGHVPNIVFESAARGGVSLGLDGLDGNNSILRHFLARLGLWALDGMVDDDNKTRVFDPLLPARAQLQTEEPFLRAAFLSGLIDGVGWRDVERDDYAIETQHRGLAELVCVLFRQLGWVCGLPRQTASPAGPVWSLSSIQHSYARQRQDLDLATGSKRTVGYGQRATSPYTSALEVLPAPVLGPQPVVQFQVQGGSGNGRFLLADGCVTHNCVLYEMCTLKHAFDANNLLGLVWRIVQESYPPIPAHYSVDLAELLSAMLAKDPQARPTVEQILDLKFIKRRLRAQIKERLKAREAAAAAAGADGSTGPGASPSSDGHHRRVTNSSSTVSRSDFHRPTLSVSTSCSSHANIFDNNMSITLPPDHERYDDCDSDGLRECEVDAEEQEDEEQTEEAEASAAARQQESENDETEPPAQSFSRPHSQSRFRPRSSGGRTSSVHGGGGVAAAGTAEHSPDHRVEAQHSGRPPRLSISGNHATTAGGAHVIGRGLVLPPSSSSSSSPHTLSPTSAQLSARGHSQQRVVGSSPSTGDSGGATPTPTSSARIHRRSRSDLARDRNREQEEAEGEEEEETYGDECDDIETQELLRSVRVGRRPTVALDSTSGNDGMHSFKSSRGSVNAVLTSPSLARLTSSSLAPDTLALGTRVPSPCASPRNASGAPSPRASPSHAGGGGGSIFAGAGPEGSMVLLGRAGGSGTGSMRMSAAIAAAGAAPQHSPNKRVVAFGTPTAAMSPSNAARASAAAAGATGSGGMSRSGGSSSSPSQHPSPSSPASASPSGSRVTVNTHAGPAHTASFDADISSPRTPSSFARMKKANLPFSPSIATSSSSGSGQQKNQSPLPPPHHAIQSAAGGHGGAHTASPSMASVATQQAKARRAAAQRIVQRESFDEGDDDEPVAAPRPSARPACGDGHSEDGEDSGSDEDSLIEQLQSQLGVDGSSSDCDDRVDSAGQPYGLPTSSDEEDEDEDAEGDECEEDEESEGEDDSAPLSPPHRHPSQRMVVESFSSKRTAPLRLQQHSQPQPQQQQASTRPRLHISRPISDSSRIETTSVVVGGDSGGSSSRLLVVDPPASPRTPLTRPPSLREKRAAVRERCLRAMSERAFDLIFAHYLSQHIMSPRTSVSAAAAAGATGSAFGFEPASPSGASVSESNRNLRVVHQLLRGAGASAADIAAASAELVFSIQQLVNLQQMLDGPNAFDPDDEEGD